MAYYTPLTSLLERIAIADQKFVNSVQANYIFIAYE